MDRPLAAESLSYRWLVTINPSALDTDDDAALFIVIDPHPRRPPSPDFHPHHTPPPPTSKKMHHHPPPPTPESFLGRSLSSVSSASSSHALVPQVRRPEKRGVVETVARKVVDMCLKLLMPICRRLKCGSSRKGGGETRRRRRREVFDCCRPRRDGGVVADAAVERSIYEAVLHCKKSNGKAE